MGGVRTSILRRPRRLPPHRRADHGEVRSYTLDWEEPVKVPVPTKPEQDRIAAVLDDFESLVNDLSVGLPAELAARRKQYEHYRDRLLTFTEAPA